MHKHSSTTGVNQTNLTADLNSWNAQVEMLNGMDDDTNVVVDDDVDDVDDDDDDDVDVDVDVNISLILKANPERNPTN